MAEITVSVVMSVFNGERYLRPAVESILDQSFQDFEFIVIDDGSTDGSASILDSYQTRDPRVKVFHQENQGLIDSLNRGCGLARGKYIARMDADDISVRDRLSWQVDFLENHSEVGLLSGEVEYINAQGKALCTVHLPTDDQEIRSALSRNECPIPHPAAVMRRSVLLSTGGYRKPFLHAEDYDLWLRFAQCSQLANLDKVVLEYRIHPSQVTSRKLRQQCLSTLGAREIASSTDTDAREILDSGSVITPEILARLDVSQAKQQHYMVKRYQDCIKTLVFAGDISGALGLATDMLSSRWEYVEKAVLAEMWLLTASFYRRQGRPLKGLSAVAHALITRPIVAARPLKRLARRLGAVIEPEPEGLM